jgi:hypothetical protein
MAVAIRIEELRKLYSPNNCDIITSDPLDSSVCVNIFVCTNETFKTSSGSANQPDVKDLRALTNSIKAMKAMKPRTAYTRLNDIVSYYRA